MNMSEQPEPVIRSEHYYTAAEGAFGTTNPDALLGQFKSLAHITHCVLLLDDGKALIGLHITPEGEHFNGEYAIKQARAGALLRL